MSILCMNFFFWYHKAVGKCIKLFIKLHQTSEFDEQFDTFELIIKLTFFFEKLKKKKKSSLMKFDGDQTFHQTKQAHQTKFLCLMAV